MLNFAPFRQPCINALGLHSFKGTLQVAQSWFNRLHYSMYCPLYFNNSLTWMRQIWYTDVIKDAEFKFINGLSKSSHRPNWWRQKWSTEKTYCIFIFFQMKKCWKQYYVVILKGTKPKFVILVPQDNTSSVSDWSVRIHCPCQQAFSFITLVFKVISSSHLIQLFFGVIPSHTMTGC